MEKRYTKINSSLSKGKISKVFTTVETLNVSFKICIEMKFCSKFSELIVVCLGKTKTFDNDLHFNKFQFARKSFIYIFT